MMMITCGFMLPSFQTYKIYTNIYKPTHIIIHIFLYTHPRGYVKQSKFMARVGFNDGIRRTFAFRVHTNPRPPQQSASSTNTYNGKTTRTHHRRLYHHTPFPPQMCASGNLMYMKNAVKTRIY